MPAGGDEPEDCGHHLGREPLLQRTREEVPSGERAAERADLRDGFADGGGAACKPGRDRSVRHPGESGIGEREIHAALGTPGGEHRHGEELPFAVQRHQRDSGEIRVANPLLLPSAFEEAVGGERFPAERKSHPPRAVGIPRLQLPADERSGHEPLGFHDYNCLQMNAAAVISDSGTLPEESSFFTSIGKPFPAVCIRTSTERPEALDKGCFILAGIDGKSLLQAVDTAIGMVGNGDNGIPVPDYVEENVSTKVVKIIQSYTGVVDRMVWRKF